MILIGQYDSPFVRRVAIALQLYGLPYEHRAWSTFGDADKIAPINPLMRVPTLLLGEGKALVDSAAILDYLDDLVGEDQAMIAPRGPERRDTLRIAALACGLGDKAVSLFYEGILRKEASEIWVNRCRRQIGAVLEALEAERGSGSYWIGDTLSHADIAVACNIRFVGEAHPDLLAEANCPKLKAGAERCESLPVFQDTSSPLAGPSGD